MTHVTVSHLKRNLVLCVGVGEYIRILSIMDVDTLDPVVTYCPFQGGPEKTLPMSVFATRFASAELGLPELAGNVYQLSGGVRATVLCATPEDRIADVMLTIGLDNGAQPFEVLASEFLARELETITVH